MVNFHRENSLEVLSNNLFLDPKQRCFHGRHGFSLNGCSRIIRGCYVGQDEFESRLRMEGYPV